MAVVEVKLHAVLTLAPEGGEQSASHSGLCASGTKSTGRNWKGGLAGRRPELESRRVE